ncbi:TPA: hypothetical protein ACN36B_004634 [Vibrio parahaemolyticus]|uniref:hypothetical protein n=1 Tax=Vibrio parahaemolyticus TaxID=670 RepID=UPI001D1FBDF0|nr:hypothetical protein [Vibrio parahaemolyticus]MBE4227518.1 hypothetical protein [Vibrio parahaemolyticus]
MKWWEKTVEYSFVLKAAKENIFNLFMPLDGDVETIGDTVVCKDSMYFILEFKKSLSDLSGEYKKYAGGKFGFAVAAEQLKDMSAYKAHFLIGGKLDSGKNYLEIEVRKYFESSILQNEFSQIFEKGVTLKEMQEYTEKLTEFKVEGNASGDEGDSSGGKVYQSVLAISKSQKTATLIPLSYFKGFQMAPVPRPPRPMMP